MERKRRLHPTLDEDPYGEGPLPELDPAGNLVTSELESGYHAPVIDLDMPCHLVPSSTPGHFHLYIDAELTWDECSDLLVGMLNAGLVQQRWVEGCLESGFMRVRHPDHPKQKKG